MKIIKNIIVKQLLTEKSKQQLLCKFNEQIERIEKEIAQLQFEKKKYEKTKKTRLSLSTIKPFEKEIETRKDRLKLLQFQRSQLEILPLGTELKETEVQGIVDIKEGDRWDEKMKEQSILIEDGVVKEIR